jgi:serine/threonine-protein kinase
MARLPSIAGFDVRRRIGTGGMGTVYEAYEEELARTVAIKVLTRHLADDPAARELFQREGRAQVQFVHPHVLNVHSRGTTDDGDFYLNLQYVAGGSIKEQQNGRPLPNDRLLALLGQMASALDAAHAAGREHRDVKSSNILADGDHAYLSDFGLASVASETTIASTGLLFGSAPYMAPEVIRGDPRSKASFGAADRYALAAVLYECLTGRPPFADLNRDAVLYAHTHRPPPRPTDRRPELPAAIDAVVARGMAKDPTKRPPTATALIGEARAALTESRRGWRVPRKAAAAVAVLAAVASGVLTGVQTSPPETAKAAPRSLATSRVSLSYAAPWRPGHGTGVPGLKLRDGLALDDPADRTTLVAGVGDGDGTTLLPAALRKGATAPTRVSVADTTALAYSDVDLGDEAGHALVVAVPTKEDVVYVVCRRRPDLTAAARSRCNAAIRSVRLRGRPAIAVGPSKAYAKYLTAVLDDLDEARSSALAEARKASTPAGQASALAGFDGPCRSALARMRRQDPGPELSARHHAIADAISRACDAYRDLWHAARDGRRTAYATARDRAATRVSMLRRAVRALEGAGYDV